MGTFSLFIHIINRHFKQSKLAQTMLDKKTKQNKEVFNKRD